MQLSPKCQIALGTGSFGLLAGIAIASGGFRDSLAKTLSIAGGAALPAIALTHFIVDTRAQSKVNESERRANDVTVSLDQANQQLEDSKARLTNLTRELEAYKRSSEKIQQQLLYQLEETKQNLLTSEGNCDRALKLIAQLQGNIEALEAQASKDKEQIAYLATEVEHWELNFYSMVNAESDKKFKAAKSTEIQKIFDEHDQITQEAMALFRQLQSWGEKVAHGHNSKREIIRGLAIAYNSNLDEINQAIDLERLGYLEQIELLNEKVARLQQEAAGDLVEPTYGDFGFDINGRIANELARTIWQDLQLPLSVKGFQVKPDGAVDIGYGYSRSVSPQAIASSISKHSEALAKKLRLFKITSVRKLEITDCIVVSFRQSPAVKDDEIKLMVGSPNQFISYITSHPIRYRLIADPGVGKTPTTAVMISEILKVGCTRGNTGKGEKVPNTLVTVSYPGAVGSLKDSSYPLDIFLKYGDTTAAIKSFEDCLEDGKYRVQNPSFAANYFQIWVWDELDNTLNSCSEPYKAGENLKKILKQFGHNNIGWIVSGQSVMTKQIPGFTNDDRSLFTEIIIGIPKIRHYLNTYGKGKNSESNLAKLTRNLDAIEEYIEHKNELVTDDARLLRVALVVDGRSPKLYFLPNLDNVAFNYQEIEETKRLARLAKTSGTTGNGMVSNALNLDAASTGTMAGLPPFSTIGGSCQNGTKPHCPHCGSANLKLQNDNRYRCIGCKKRTVINKIVWR
ncbi:MULTISPECIES: hypothetical protein [unclassified Tolypothrix]|uniref:hypothetical protein n=1 Tax=unclassified Tolypothrix TaxID=2649714 RepID=UPI0005F832AD|nr:MULTISPECIES: hypothetical protein [unclassified Tolypothrix]MBE9084153.1 hypothetical protein [Tolypothrix sp. LEGE 11397]UYD31055.1 hypothetical protein HGR01_39940 [Tolypothrix sp. PCC 7712]BAY96028.1 hypothetical protein NIES3275_81050 [Microchaete diplosiphon NIES-3275]